VKKSNHLHNATFIENSYIRGMADEHYMWC